MTFSYLKKHFWLPMLVMLAPSVVMCFLYTPYWELTFVTAFDYAPYVGLGTTLRIMFGDSWQYLWPVVVVSICQIAGATLLTAAMDKHFRTGKLSLRMPLRLINNTVFPMTLGVLVMCAVSIVWRLVLFGLVSLVQVIGDGLNFWPSVTIALITIIAFVMFFFHVMIITPMLFWAPTMFIYGYRFRDAAASSLKLISGKHVFINMFLPLMLCAAVQLTVGFLQPHIAVTYAVNFVTALVTNVFVPVFVIITFYSISGLERRDIKPHEMPLPMLERPGKGGKGGGDVL